jgi:hypothetical protein
MIVPFVVVVALAVVIGIWRRFGPIQWIWLLFGTAIALLVVWLLVLVLVIAPEMRRQGPPGQRRGMPVGMAEERPGSTDAHRQRAGGVRTLTIVQRASL